MPSRASCTDPSLRYLPIAKKGQTPNTVSKMPRSAPLVSSLPNLAAVMLSLNLLAFLFHTVLEWSDDKYALLRQVLASRQTFFHDIQALMRYMVFDSWNRLIDFMIRGLDLESRCDTS